MSSADFDIYMSTFAAADHRVIVTDVHERIAHGLADDGWCVIAEFLNDETVAALRHEALARWQEGCYHLARVGRGEAAAHRPDVRCDQVVWLEPPYSDAQAGFLAGMETLRLALNQHALLGLFDFECHFTRYAPGAFYKRHLDRFHNESSRTVSVILYLNEKWTAADGGALRLYLEAGNEAGYRDIAPLGGSLVCFRSDRFWHEVLPTTNERLSLTGWFRTRV